jgi:hypothetical protein
MKKIGYLILVVIFALSCSQKSSEEAAFLETESPSAPYKGVDKKETPTLPDELQKADVIKKKIIKDGRMGISVSDLQKAKTGIDTVLHQLGGYYDNENLNNYDYACEYQLKIRIPADKFELFVSKIEKGGDKINYKEIEARDVTDQFIDLETRLANKQRYLMQYQTLLKSAKNIKDILEIQEKIRALEEELESTIGRLKYLSDLVNYSTLELNISEKKDYKYTPEDRDNITEKIKESIVGGWFSFVDFLLILLYNWVFLIILSGLIYLWIKYRKRRKNRKNKSSDNK